MCFSFLASNWLNISKPGSDNKSPVDGLFTNAVFLTPYQGSKKKKPDYPIVREK